MTYHPEMSGELTLTEYTCASQTRLAGEDVVWDQTTKRSTASTQRHSVSGDTITLNGPACFWVFVSPDVTRGSSTYDVNFRFLTDDGSVVLRQNKASFLRSRGIESTNMTCYTVFNVPIGGQIALTCRYSTSTYSITVNPSMSVHIWEVHE